MAGEQALRPAQGPRLNERAAQRARPVDHPVASSRAGERIDDAVDRETRDGEAAALARSIGAGRSKIMFQHILPNVMSPIIVAATLEIGAAIITESALSFLGLGFPSDVPTWGRMLFDAKDYIQLSPHEALIPGTFIFLTVLSINYIGDGLRDALDPRKTH